MSAKVDKRWVVHGDRCRYFVEAKGSSLEIWKDTGNKETTFGRIFTARQFLDEENSKSYREVLGDKVYQQINVFLTEAINNDRQ